MPFNGINNLRDHNESVPIEPWQLDEIRKCARDPMYFILNYVYINTKDKGMQLFKLWDFQKDVLEKYIKYRFNILKFPRQSGKSSLTMAYLLWYSVFNNQKVVVILANKLSLAQEQLQHLRDSYISLPYWMQPGVSQWNKREVRLSHGTRIKCSATSPDTVRGMAINALYLDEFSFVKPHIANEFIASVFPTISSGKTTKVIITSTPCGMNHYYHMWQDAKGDYGVTSEGNGYVRSEIAWNSVPGRDEKWAREQIASIGEIRFNQEYKCINYNETITIKNKKTSLIEKISIGMFYEKIKQNNKMNDIFTNEYEILTPHGFVNFNGIRETKKSTGITLHFSDNSIFICKPEHKIKTLKGFIKANKTINHKLIKSDKEITVINITKNNHKECFYDVLEIKNKDHSFYSSDIISHNCDFIGSVSTLIDHNYLKELTSKPPLRIPRLPDCVKIWELPRKPEELEAKNWEYVASLDSGYGIYADNSVLQICLVKSNITIHQVAKISSNSMDIEEFCKKARNLLKCYHDPRLIIEQNGPGIATMQFFQAKSEYENILHFDPNGRHMGLWATDRLKETACILLKTCVQRNFLKIYDIQTIEELHSFGKVSQKKWGALGGNNDDHITSIYWITYYVNTPFFYGNIVEVDMKKVSEDDFLLTTAEERELAEKVMAEVKDPNFHLEELRKGAEYLPDSDKSIEIEKNNDNDPGGLFFRV